MTDSVDLGYSRLLIYGTEENDLPLSSLTDALASGSSGTIGTATTTMNSNMTTDVVDPSTLDSGDVLAQLTLSSRAHIKGGQTAYNTGSGFFLGWETTTYKFSIGDGASNYMTWDGTTLSIGGTISAGAIDIGGADATSFHVDASGNMWLGAATFGAATFSVSSAGAATATNITITGGSVAVSTLNGTISLGNLNVAAQGWSQTSAFTVTDADTIAWGSGTFTTAAGTAYSISSGNTGNMAAKTYVYLDTNVSSTVYQTTTTAATAVGGGKVLVAIAQNATGEATFTVLSGQGGQNIDASSIVANSITANELSTSIVYAGVITIDTAGNIHSGQSSYNTGTGFFLGNVTGTPKFSIGDASANNSLTWDGSTLRVNGSTINFGDVYGDGSDGAVVISGDTTLTRDMFYTNLTIDSTFTLNTGGFRVHCTGTLTVNGTIGRPGSAGGAGGDTTTTTGGVAGTAGAALASGSMNGTVAGVAGATGGDGSSGSSNTLDSNDNAVAGTAGNAVVKSLTDVNGVAAGGSSASIAMSTAIGTITGGAATSGGAAGTKSGTVFNKPNTAFAAWLLQDFFPSADSLRSSAGSGSGASGSGGGWEKSGGGTATVTGTGGGGGGGSGSPGGLVGIYAKTIVVGAAGVITAVGGAGGRGGNSGDGTITGSIGGDANAQAGGAGGGGGGGSGGFIVLVYSSLTNSGSITVAGGAAGAGGTHGRNNVSGVLTDPTGSSGTAGTAGIAGLVVQLTV